MDFVGIPSLTGELNDMELICERTNLKSNSVMIENQRLMGKLAQSTINLDLKNEEIKILKQKLSYIMDKNLFTWEDFIVSNNSNPGDIAEFANNKLIKFFTKDQK